MDTLFGFSYALLWVVILAQAVLLRRALHEAVMLKRLYPDLARLLQPGSQASGTLAPDFSAPILGSGERLNRSNLIANPAIIVFVSPSEASLPGYQELGTAIHTFWHRVEGHVYLVCTGSEQACRQFSIDHRVNTFAIHQIPLVLDSQATIARAFQINSTPMAVELDEDCLITRYGRPVVNSTSLEE